MKNFTMEDLKRLTAIKTDLSISMYMPADPPAAATDGLQTEELHQRALRSVRPVLEANQKEDRRHYRTLAGKGYTSAGVQSVVPAAAFGRAETLFVALHERRPGLFDRQRSRATIAEHGNPDAEDLLELAVVKTIENGGQVYALERNQLPDEHASVAAILRH